MAPTLVSSLLGQYGDIQARNLASVDWEGRVGARKPNFRQYLRVCVLRYNPMIGYEVH